MLLSKISNVLIISHYYKRTTSGGGPPQEIRDFFLPRIKKVYYIEHPFPQADDHRSSMTIYNDGKIEREIFTPSFKGPQILFYIFDIFLTFYFLLLVKKKIDLCIALDNLNTANILPLRKIGIIKKLIFYTIDYNPKRFKNKILNNIYHFLDRVSCYHADAIWVLSKKMDTTRAKNKVDIKKMAKSILLPMGANLERINILPQSKINRHQLAFTGFLMKKQGVQIILQALPKVIEKIPDVKLVIIGQGEYEDQLKNLSKSLKISKHVDFKGFVNNHREVENILCKSAIGMATYENTPDNYTMFTDPGKPKLYLGCGLPVVITNVPQVAKIIASRNAGLIVKYDKKSVADALIKLLFDDNLYKSYRENAIELSKEYNTNSLIDIALKKTP